jgi:flagellar assembly factor FliW
MCGNTQILAELIAKMHYSSGNQRGVLLAPSNSGGMKMNSTSTHSAEIKHGQNTLIDFPNGLNGFKDCKRFNLFHPKESPIMFSLKSVDNPAVELSMADTKSLKVTYELSLTDEEKSTLQVEDGDKLQTAIMVANEVKDNIAAAKGIFANFQSPIVINVSKRIALQKTFHNAELLIRA